MAMSDIPASAVAAEGRDPEGRHVRLLHHRTIVDQPVGVVDSEGFQVVQATFDSLTANDYLTSEIVRRGESWKRTRSVSVDVYTARGRQVPQWRSRDGDGLQVRVGRLSNPTNGSTSSSYPLALVKGYDEMQDGTATSSRA